MGGERTYADLPNLRLTRPQTVMAKNSGVFRRAD
jgi:hypothetical protein